jgi:hypothetical protein
VNGQDTTDGARLHARHWLVWDAKLPELRWLTLPEPLALTALARIEGHYLEVIVPM